MVKAFGYLPCCDVMRVGERVFLKAERLTARRSLQQARSKAHVHVCTDGFHVGQLAAKIVE